MPHQNIQPSHHPSWSRGGRLVSNGKSVVVKFVSNLSYEAEAGFLSAFKFAALSSLVCWWFPSLYPQLRRLRTLGANRKRLPQHQDCCAARPTRALPPCVPLELIVLGIHIHTSRSWRHVGDVSSKYISLHTTCIVYLVDWKYQYVYSYTAFKTQNSDGLPRSNAACSRCPILFAFIVRAKTYKARASAPKFHHFNREEFGERTFSCCFVASAAHIILHDVHHYHTQLKSISLPLTKNNNITAVYPAIYRSISDFCGKTLALVLVNSCCCTYLLEQ